MRLSDLLAIIGLTTRPFRADIPAALRLDMMKRAFPRPDLLEWFDALPLGDVPPCDYFPLLACAFARRVQARFTPGRLVVAGSTDRTIMRHVSALETDVLPWPAESTPPHEVGLLLAQFDTAADLAALPEMLAASFSRAATLMLFADAAWAALGSTSWAGRQFFAGELQSWAPTGLHAVALHPAR